MIWNYFLCLFNKYQTFRYGQRTGIKSSVPAATDLGSLMTFIAQIAYVVE